MLPTLSVRLARLQRCASKRHLAPHRGPVPSELPTALEHLALQQPAVAVALGLEECPAVEPAATPALAPCTDTTPAGLTVEVLPQPAPTAAASREDLRFQGEDATSAGPAALQRKRRCAAAQAPELIARAVPPIPGRRPGCPPRLDRWRRPGAPALLAPALLAPAPLVPATPATLAEAPTPRPSPALATALEATLVLLEGVVAAGQVVRQLRAIWTAPAAGPGPQPVLSPQPPTHSQPALVRAIAGLAALPRSSQLQPRPAPLT